MTKAFIGASAAAVIALAPLCIPPAQAHADDPCVGITDPAAHQACMDEVLRNDPMRRYQGNCESTPNYGAEGQLCRDSWVRKSARPTGVQEVGAGGYLRRAAANRAANSGDWME